MKELIIGVDTGNRCIKTRNAVFVAGVKASDTAPIANQDVIAFNGKYWALTNDRIPYLQDKTETEDYFVLTLFALVKELAARKIELKKDRPVPVHLGIGLPPSHVTRLKERFVKYFSRGMVTFRYNNQPVSIKIIDVRLFAQGYAAIVGLPPAVRKAPHAYIVDIGGYTTDVMSLEHGVLDPRFCSSLDFGVIRMYGLIQTAIHTQTGRAPTEDMIDEVLAGDSNSRMDEDMKRIAFQIADDYVADVMRKLTELGVDLTLNQGIFVGGGSARLKDRIEKSSYVRDPFFAGDIHSNAVGYEAFITAMERQKVV